MWDKLNDHLFLRVTEPSDEELNDIVRWLSGDDDVGRFIISKEVGKETLKPHIHAVIKSRKAVQTFRVAFSRKFPQFKGNGRYSVKSVRDEGAIGYICKDGNIFASEGIFKLTPEEYAAKYVDVGLKIKEERKSKKWLETVVQICMDNNWDYKEHTREIFYVLTEHIPHPVDHLIVKYMRKVQRMLDLGGYQANAWYRLQEQVI